MERERERLSENELKHDDFDAIKKKNISYQELVDVHRRVDRDLPAKVVFKLVLATAGRRRFAEELGEALLVGRERESFLFRRRR